MQIVRGSIQDCSRNDGYDAEGDPIAVSTVRVNGQRYSFTLPKKDAPYLSEGQDVVLAVDDDNNVIAGACPKKGWKWGKSKLLRKEVSDADIFSLAAGKVLEKRRETFTVNLGTAGGTLNPSNMRYETNYTIVLPDQRFRVVEFIGKHIKPDTHITALIHEDVAFIVHVRESGQTYGKPAWSWLISLALWVGFNLYMLHMAETGQKAVFTDYDMVMIIGNITLALVFLFPFTGFLSDRKTFRLFKRMTAAQV